MKDTGKIIDFSSQRAQLINSKYQDKLRSYDGIIEYSFLRDYETLIEPATQIEVDDLAIVIYEGKENIVLLGIHFPISKYKVEDAVQWLETYQVVIIPKEKDTGLVNNASSIKTGIKFKGNIILICQKGYSQVTYNSNEFVEITEHYKLIERSLNLAASRVLNLGKAESFREININQISDLDNFERIDIDRGMDKVYVNGLSISVDYIDRFCDTIGFFFDSEEELEMPIAFIFDPESIKIEIQEMENGCRIYTIESVSK